jgi:hypothetical protein
MQYWVIYQGGVGGDGFANLLEHANNMFPADGENTWRIHYYEGAYGILQRPVRFYQANWTNDPLPFRSKILPETTILNPVYVDLINQGKNTVVSAHYNYFNLVNKFEHKNIVKQDQVMINLYSNRAERVYQDHKKKRPDPIIGDLTNFTKSLQRANFTESNRPDYAIHIDIEQAWRDWSYLNNCLGQLGINLDKKFYDYYLTYIDNL